MATIQFAEHSQTRKMDLEVGEQSLTLVILGMDDFGYSAQVRTLQRMHLLYKIVQYGLRPAFRTSTVSPLYAIFQGIAVCSGQNNVTLTLK